MMERRKVIGLTTALVLVSSVVSFYVGAARLLPNVNRWVTPDQAESTGQVALDVARIKQVQNYIQKNFVESISTEKLTEGALRGMVEATGDKYSVYFDPKEYKEFFAHLDPSFSGIGVTVEISPQSGLVTVIAPIKGSPGEKAGLRPGDAIIKVNDKEVAPPIALEEVVRQIRGPAGTTVNLAVKRQGVDQPLQFTITRAAIDLPTTDGKMLEGGVGYLQLLEFNRGVSAKVSKAIVDLRNQGMTRMILDLRQDPGGYLDEAVKVASQFIPANQPVVHTIERDKPKQTLSSLGSKVKWDLPLVVLVDEGSASAAEILAGALKDLKVGTLVGVKTFGKGSVQSFFDDLPDGAGVKLTTAKWLTSGGNQIQGKGIEPDVKVENPKGTLIGDPQDVQLREAVRIVTNMTR